MLTRYQIYYILGHFLFQIHFLVSKLHNPLLILKTFSGSMVSKSNDYWIPSLALFNLFSRQCWIFSVTTMQCNCINFACPLTRDIVVALNGNCLQNNFKTMINFWVNFTVFCEKHKYVGLYELDSHIPALFLSLEEFSQYFKNLV